MRTIWKFLIVAGSMPVARMPRGSSPVAAKSIAGVTWVWAIVDPTAPIVDHQFAVQATGQEITPEVELGDYVGTVFDGPFVWHVISLGDIGS